MSAPCSVTHWKESMSWAQPGTVTFPADMFALVFLLQKMPKPPGSDVALCPCVYILALGALCVLVTARRMN